MSPIYPDDRRVIETEAIVLPCQVRQHTLQTVLTTVTASVSSLVVAPVLALPSGMRLNLSRAPE